MIDSHCHLNYGKIAENISKVIINSKLNNVTALLSINTIPNEFNAHLKLIKDYEGIYLSYGLHPCEVKSYNDITNLKFDNYCNNPYVVGIGETGIDLFHSKEFLKEQIKCFENHIEASIKYKLPLIIHQRNSENEIINVLKNYLKYQLKVVFHCFAGSKNLMVSNWYVETYSTKDLITSFFNETKNNKNLTISQNLNNSMIKFIKENKDKSHPVFWAPFVIVGNDQKLNI